MAGRTTPFTDLEELFEEFVSFGPTRSNPPLDVIDTEDELRVFVDLPGRDPERIEVGLEEGRRLTIETDRRETRDAGRYLTQERTEEAVSRTVPLPTVVDEEGTSASYDDGVLSITLPKEQPDGEGTQIPVE